ncbi:hypothetical protein ACSFBF_06955 [Variovorax sp. ZT5P49]|uniref:hypothetical protein n=1 Tax=Variovorax sp. ZT5P49 TaxID=3443733 RepID=UPI003F44F95F
MSTMTLIDDWRARRAAARAARTKASAEPTQHVVREKARIEALDGKLNRLLACWYEWTLGYSHTRGYSGSDSTCRDYSTPTHWDWRNGAEDERAEQERMRGVDAALKRVPNTPRKWRLALEIQAMNLHSEAAVWSSGRLPSGDELTVLLLEARNMLLRELQAEGVMT